MRVLLGHIDYEHPTSIRGWYESWLARLRTAGISVDGFCLTLDPSKPNLIWSELDALWRVGDKVLLTMYQDLARRLENYDVFVNYNGVNLHPDFVKQLPTFNVYGCVDDPESSEHISRPVAAAYDLAMVGNIAAVEDYRSWGVKEARFWPMGFRADDYDPSLTSERILTGMRDVEVALTCERVTHWRKERVDKFAAAFPQGKYFGKGWPNGFLPEEERVPLYQRTRIGINIHNSTGPINFRTYILPANGVMQVCDNKSHLGRIFELGKEAAGFDTIEEAIELCHHFLAHEDERREIAVNGWRRALRDYNEVAVFKLMLSYVEQLRGPAVKELENPIAYLRRQRQRTFARRSADRLAFAARYVRAALRNRWRVVKGQLPKKKARA